MHKSPLRNWNGKYDAAVAQVQQIVKKLEGAVAPHQQKANQIGQWDKQVQAYQTWSKAPQTADMHLIAQGLGAPQYFSVKYFGMNCAQEVSIDSATFFNLIFEEQSLTERY